MKQQLQEAQIVLQKARVTAVPEDYAKLYGSEYYELFPVSLQKQVQRVVVDQPNAIAHVCSQLVMMAESIMEEYGAKPEVSWVNYWATLVNPAVLEQKVEGGAGCPRAQR